MVGLRIFQSSVAVMLFVSGLAGGMVALADDESDGFRPGNLLVSRAVYDNNAKNVVAGTTLLPPNCVAPACVTATDSGTYPSVWNNSLVDGSFGITAKIVLDQLKPPGSLVNSLEVPSSEEQGVSPNRVQMVSSFPSKSEIALNLSTDGRSVTFMGYLAPVNALDVSNSNTPAVVDPTNPVTQSNFRVVAAVDEHGRFRFTKTNAYSGNNGRAAILNDKNGANILYTSGNAGNGANPQPNGIIIGAGPQILTAERKPLVAQDPGLPTPVGSFSITQLGLKADKVGKDTNFRGLAIFNNVLYTTKGSGGNGINTVYFVDTTGFDSAGRPLACPNGVGLPGASASLPTAPIFYDATVLQTKGVTPYNMCILKGLPTATKSTTSFPFGIWFADAKNSLCRGRRRRYQHLRSGDGQLCGGSQADRGGPAKVDLQLEPRCMETRIRAAGRIGARRSLHRRRLSDRPKSKDRAAMVAGDRRTSQHHGPRQWRRHRHALGDHLDCQRKR